MINGLRPFVDVVAIGDTTCGKPVGFRPVSRCDTTFNVVNFEAVNADNQGRYFGGIEPRCAVEENLSQPLGAPDEPLLAAVIQAGAQWSVLRVNDLNDGSKSTPAFAGRQMFVRTYEALYCFAKP